MQRLLISLGLDLNEWKSGIKKAKRQFSVLIEGTKKRLNREFKGIGKGLGRAIKGSLVVAGAGATIFGMTQMIADHSRHFENLQKTTGSTAAQMQLLKEDVYDLNRELGLRSVDAAVEKMSTVARLSRKTGDELKQLTFQTGLLGKEFGDEENQLTAQLSLMKAFKTSVGEVGDVMAYLNKQGGDLKGELLESVKEYSVQFAEAGFNIDQTVAILKSGLEQGWNVDKAADAFKEGRLRLMGGDKATVDAMKLLGLGNLDEQIKKGAVTIPQAMSKIQTELNKLNKTEQFRIAKEIFGAQYEDIGGDAMAAMLSGMNVKLKTSGSIDLLTNDLQGRFSYKWDRAVSNSTNAFSRMLDSLKPHVLPLIEWFGKATETVSNFSKKYGYIAKTIGASIGIITVLTGVLGGIAVVAGIAGAAFTVLTSPILLVIAAVVGVGIGLVYLEKKTGVFSKTFKALSPKIKSIAARFSQLGKRISPVIDYVTNLLKAFDWSKAGKAFEMTIDRFFLAPIRAIVAAFDGVLDVSEAALSLFENGFSKESVGRLANSLKSAFVNPVAEFFDFDSAKTILGPGSDEESPKASPREIRENESGNPFRLKSTTNWETQVAQGTSDDKNVPSVGKQVTVHIKNYHSNSNNAAADWETQGLIAG